MGSYGVNHGAREAIVSGIFYPDDPGRLAAMVDNALGIALVSNKHERNARPLAILSPHAAFEYARDVQASAWAAAAVGPVDRIVIIAALARPGESAAYLPESPAFRTPLGDVAVDTGACADLESCNTLFASNDIPHLESHAIEVQLPYMRRLFPNALLIPVLVSGSPVIASSLGRALDVVFGDEMDRTLVVASSNLASSIVAADAARRSDDVERLMASGAWRELSERVDIPGAMPIAAAMAVDRMRGARYRLLQRIDSLGHATPVSKRIVHYAAAAWYRGGLK